MFKGKWRVSSIISSASILHPSGGHRAQGLPRLRRQLPQEPPHGDHLGAQRLAHSVGQSALLLGLAIFGLLWLLYSPIREIYVPNRYDIPALADGLLLAPGAHWQDWFTRGYSHFWELYPDRPGEHGKEFARPAFQFLIYLAHFVLGRDWASYQLINCFAVAGMGAVAFQIAQAVLRLRTGPSLVAAMLVVLSPPVLNSWLLGLGFAIEPLATVLVAGAFLAVLARRDFLCLAFLFLALLTKENTVWAPVAAAITIMLRPKLDESLRRRAFTAAAMLLPVAMWLGLRFTFFGGIGGTYATAGYTPLADFLKLTFYKLAYLHYLFITHQARPELPDRGTALLILDWGMALLIYALLSLWALRILPEVVNRIRCATHDMRWPTVDPVFLVALWALIALAFHFALPLLEERYATSVVVFAWPALVAEVERRAKTIIWLGLAVCCAVSLTRSSYLLIEWTAEPVRNDNFRSMDTVLRQVPTGTREIYVLSAGGLQEANPEYVRLVLGVSAEIVRVVEIDWNCREASDLVAFDHSTADGVVSMTVTLPTCANFHFFRNRLNDITHGHLYRNDRMSYEVPEAYPNKSRKWWWQPSVYLGRRMIVHFRPNGPARFVIEHGGPNGIAWFDTS
jgi:hypothetical protein